MEANRLAAFNAIVEEVRKEIEDGISSWRDRALMNHIDKLREDNRRLHELYDAQYARSCEYAGQIERLNRAYEVLKSNMKYFAQNDSVAQMAINRAQRIKEGKDGEQG